MELNKELRKYLSEKETFLAVLKTSELEQQEYRIDFEELSFKQKEEVINLIIEMYDKDKEFLNYSYDIFDISFFGSWNIRYIERITLGENQIYLSSVGASFLLTFEDLNLFKNHYWKNDGDIEEEK